MNKMTEQPTPAVGVVVSYDPCTLQAEEFSQRTPHRGPVNDFGVQTLENLRQANLEVLELQKAGAHRAITKGQCACGLKVANLNDEPVSDEILAQTEGHVDHVNGCLVDEPIWHVGPELSKQDGFQAEEGQKLGYFGTITVISGSKRSSGETEWNVFCYECHNHIGLGQLEADYRLELLEECHASLHKHHTRSEWDW